MESFTIIFNKIAAIGSLAILATALYVLIQICIAKNTPTLRFLKRNAIRGIVILSASSLFLSLIYSNIIGYPPCLLCWIVRITFVVILILSAWILVKKNTILTPFLIFFSIAGAIVALYNTIIMYIGFSPLPCSAEVSCTVRYVYEFGFVTIPFMALAVFALIVLFSFLARERKTFIV